MCDDHARLNPNRRDVLHGAGALAAGALLLRGSPRQLPPQPPRQLPRRSLDHLVNASGFSAFSMAMHIHSSFSEQSGSMESQFYQASINAVSMFWSTDHDDRMSALKNGRDTVHFTSLTAEKGAPGQGGVWKWTPKPQGPYNTTTSGGTIVTSPCSPNDPVAGGALSLTAQTTSKWGKAATYGFWADSHPAGWNYQQNLTGQSMSLDVLLAQNWTKGYLEFLITSSWHQASGTRPAGDYAMSYRFIPGSGAPAYTIQGTLGIITVPLAGPGDNTLTLTPATDGSGWVTAVVNPSENVATLWPDLDYHDFASWRITLNAVSTGDLVSGYFDYLNINRAMSGEVYLKQQQDMAAWLAAKYPSVGWQQGLEVSWTLPHMNWFGGNVALPQHGALTNTQWAPYLASTVVPDCHAASGLCSYNHPYGYSDVPPLSQAQQDALLQQIAKTLLPANGVPAALGADLLEVGYNLRQGVDLQHHISLWDVLSRNAAFLTANGVSDDHFGTNWYGLRNNWVTMAWAASTGQTDLLAAMAAGRCWAGSLSAFPASAGAALDVVADGCPMGSVSKSAVPARQLTVTGTGLPAGGQLQVLQGTVDYAGAANPVPDTAVLASYSDTVLAGSGGQVIQPVDNTNESFVRTQVLDSTGTIVAISNPVWLLHNDPPNGVPAARAC